MHACHSDQGSHSHVYWEACLMLSSHSFLSYARQLLCVQDSGNLILQVGYVVTQFSDVFLLLTWVRSLN